MALVALATSAVFSQETPEISPKEEPAREAEKPASPPTHSSPPPIAIEIDLTAQKAWLLQDGQRVYETPISSGRTAHETPTGTSRYWRRTSIINRRSTARSWMATVGC
jgi:hypothetical protein